MSGVIRTGKARKPVDVLHKCRYTDEIIGKLKAKDWEEGKGYLVNKEHIVLFLYDKDAAIEIHPYLSEYETADFFTLLKAPYKEWKHVKNIPYDTKYGLDPSWIIEIIRILYGGFSAKIMGKVVLGFLPTMKPIIMHVPYKDDYAVFIIAPLIGEEGLEKTEIYGEKWELDYWLGDKPTYYDLERQIIGFYVEGKIVSIDEYRELVREKIKEKEIPSGITVYSIARPVELSAVKDYGIIEQVELEEKRLPKGYAVLLKRRPPNELLERWELFVLEPVTTQEVTEALKIDEHTLKLFAEDIQDRGFDAVLEDATEDIYREVRKEIKWKEITREDAERITREILKKAEKFIEVKQPKDIFEEGVKELRERYLWDELIEEARRVGVEPKIIKEAIDSHHVQVSKITGEVLTRRWKPETGLAKVEDQLRRITETLKKHIEKKVPPSIPPQLERLVERAAEYESATEFRKKLTHGDIRKIEDLGFLCVPKVTSVEEFWSLAQRIKPPVKIEEKIKVRVLEDIPTFMGTDGKIYELKKGDIVELPKTNADMLVGRKVAEFVEEKRVLEGLKLRLFEKVKKELDFEDISLSEDAEEIVKEAVEVYYDTGKPELVRELLKRVIPHGDEIGNIVISIVDEEREIPEEKYPIESWYLVYTPHLSEKYQWTYQIRGSWDTKRFKTFEDARTFINKGKGRIYIHFLRGEGIATWEPIDIAPFVLEVGEKFKIPPEEYELVQPAFLSEHKKWRWGVSIWNEETEEGYSRDIFEDELLKLKEKAEKVPEKVRIHGVLKTRYRCPICYRAAPDNLCVVHGDVKAIDLLAADESVKEAVIDLSFLDLFKTKQPEKKRWTIDELHDTLGIDTAYALEFLTKTRPPETYAEYYAREFGVTIEGVKPPVPEEVKPPVEKRTETQEAVYEYFKKEIDETNVESYQRGYLDALHREIGREFTVDHLLLADSEELYRLIDLKREELEAELKRRVVPVPPSVEELAEKEKLEILRKTRKYKRVTAEVPELKIGATVTINEKKGVLVDISAGKYRVNWDDGTWDWVKKKDSEIIVVY